MSAPVAPPVARLQPEVPASLWAFETAMVACAVENLALPELATADATGGLEGTVDLCRSDGTPLRRMATLPLRTRVPVGASRRLELGLDMKALAGDYQLRLGLQRTRSDGESEPLPVDAPPAPVRVRYTIFDAFVELTNACNFKCTFCPQPTMRRDVRLMDFELATKVVGDLAAMGHHYPINAHLLGEPLLDKRVFDFVRMVHDHGQRVHLTTNGSMFEPHHIESIFRSGVDELLISLNTPDEASYDAQRGVDTPFSAYVAGIERMVRELVRRGPPPRTRMNILYRHTEAADPEARRRLHRLASSWVDVVRRASGVDVPELAELELNPPWPLHVQLVDGFELQWNAYHTWGEKGNLVDHFCSFPWRQIGVLVDGQVTACCVDGHGEICLGDARTQSIEEIWNGPELNRLREGFLNHRAVEPRCRRCEIRDDVERYFPSATMSP